MKSSPEIIRLTQPLREVRLAQPAPDPETLRRIQEAERAAFERGRREGEKALSEQLLEQRSQLLELQNGVLQSLRQLLPQMAREGENMLVALALEAARKVVAGLPVTTELVEATVREALAQVEETNEFTILLHSEDLELLQRINSPLLLSEVGGQRMHFQAAGEVTRGGCVVRTRFGTVDARPETKFELLRKSLEIR